MKKRKDLIGTEHYILLHHFVIPEIYIERYIYIVCVCNLVWNFFLISFGCRDTLDSLWPKFSMSLSNYVDFTTSQFKNFSPSKSAERLESVRIGNCQNAFFLKIGKRQSQKMTEVESVRFGKCQNWKVSELKSLRIGKCKNWKVSESERVWQLQFLHISPKRPSFLKNVPIILGKGFFMDSGQISTKSRTTLPQL